MARAKFTEQGILRQLDRHAGDFSFPTLNNLYIELVDVRLTAFRDDRRWALAIEHIGYFNRALAFGNHIYGYGNCLLGEPGHGTVISFVDENDNVREDGTHFIRSGLRSVRIRGQRIALTPDELAPPTSSDGTARGRLRIEDLFRRLLPRCRDSYRATEDELHAVVPSDLPQILRLDEWEHSDAVREVLPSHTEFFPMLAKVLVTGDPSHYKPTKPPNTHWSNWLER